MTMTYERLTSVHDRVDWLEAENANLKEAIRDLTASDYSLTIAANLRCAPQEARILALLAERHRSVVTEKALSCAISGPHAFVGKDQIKVLVCRCRRALERAHIPMQIESVCGTGAYRLMGCAGDNALKILLSWRRAA